MEFRKSLEIAKSADEISRYCLDFENQSRFLGKAVRLQAMPDRYLHWEVNAPFGVELQGQLKHTSLASGRLLIWSSTAESGPHFEITLEIFEKSSGDECEVILTYECEPLNGAMCSKALALAGLDPAKMIPQILRQMKIDIEDAVEVEASDSWPQEFFTMDVWAARAHFA